MDVVIAIVALVVGLIGGYVIRTAKGCPHCYCDCLDDDEFWDTLDDELEKEENA